VALRTMQIRFPDDERFPAWRIAFLQYAIAATFLVLLLGYWRLQIFHHRAYLDLAERNRIRNLPVIAPRGRILDREGRILTDNFPAFSVLLMRESPANFTPARLAGVARGLGLDAEDLQRLVERTAKVNMRKYFGLYHINETPVPADAETEWVLRLNEIASGYDAIIVTDYGLGMMTKRLIGAVTHLPLFLAVNTQTNSMNYGFNLITKYPRADYVSISLPEARLAFHDKASGAEDLIKRIAKTVSAESVAITLGSRGVLFLDADGRTQIPALSTSVVDNIGAGDAFLALSSLGVHLRFPRLLTGFLGATASALSCRIVANKETVDRTMLLETIRSLLKSHENGAALRASETAALRKRGTRQFCSTPA